MKYLVPIQGVETRRVMVELAGIFSGAKLMVDGRAAPKGAKRGHYLIYRDDGSDSIARLKNRFLDPVPNVVVDGEEIELVEPLRWYQWLWAGLPILLIFGGGLLGAGIGFLATGLSARIFRADISGPGQYGLVALVSVGAVIVYFILVVILVAIFQ